MYIYMCKYVYVCVHWESRITCMMPDLCTKKTRITGLICEKDMSTPPSKSSGEVGGWGRVPFSRIQWALRPVVNGTQRRGVGLIKWYSTPSPNLSPYIFLCLDPNPPRLVVICQRIHICGVITCGSWLGCNVWSLTLHAIHTWIFESMHDIRVMIHQIYTYMVTIDLIREQVNSYIYVNSYTVSWSIKKKFMYTCKFTYIYMTSFIWKINSCICLNSRKYINSCIYMNSCIHIILIYIPLHI